MDGADVTVLHRATVRKFHSYDGTRPFRATCTTCTWECVRPTLAEAQSLANDHSTPALEFLLSEDCRDYGPGGFCPDCPFRDPARSHEERQGIDVSNDYTEATYDCTLLGKAVWGEYSPCTEADWKARGRSELLEVRLLALLARSRTPADA